MNHPCAVYQRPDGGVSVVQLWHSPRLPSETEEQWIHRLVERQRACLRQARVGEEETREKHAERLVAADKPRILCELADLPSRRWRDCWTIQDGQVVVDLDKARLQRAAELEARRKAAYDRVTAALQEAEDEGRAARATQLRAKRRALRNLDLAERLASVETLEELESLVPAEIADTEGD